MILFSILSPLENLFRAILDWLHNSGHLPWAWAIVATRSRPNSRAASSNASPSRVRAPHSPRSYCSTKSRPLSTRSSSAKCSR